MKLKFKGCILICLLSINCFGQLINSNEFVIRQKSYPIGKTGIQTKNSVKWEQSNVTFNIDSMSRCVYFEMETPNKKITYYNSFDSLDKSTTLIIAQHKDSAALNQTYIEYINGVKSIEGLAIEGRRIGKWIKYDVLSGEIIGYVNFVKNKEDNEKENCAERFLCSFILEEWGDVKGIIEGFGR